MLSRLKKINPDLSASGIALVIAMLSVFIALGSDNAPCLSANATCSVGQNPEFTGDIDIKSDTIYNATIGHNLSANATYSLVQPGYNHTGNLAVIDSANDLNVGGAVVFGSSATSTLGAVRFDSNVLQVYDSSGAWVGVGANPTDDIGQVTSDSGSFTASSQQDNINVLGGVGVTTSITGDSLTVNATNDIGTVAGDTGSFSSSSPSDTVNIVGSGGISTSVTGDTLTISSSSGGTPITAYFGLSANQTTSSQNGVPFNVEKYDSDNCFTLNYNSVGSDITYTCADTRVFKVGVRYHFYHSSAYAWVQYVGVNLANYPSAYQMELYYSDAVNDNNGGHDTGYVENYICLEQNNDLEFVFGSMPNGVSMRGSSQLQRNNVQVSEDPGLTALAQSNGCTNGVID